ncbi:hypothetical protein [Consotaella aegiceratis]|uniref:hypothetical protein n=1 Tax=Consotaella aegiceratis TaxID=3097961 RepID=UPI002F41619A
MLKRPALLAVCSALVLISAGGARADDLTYHNSRFGTSATFPVDAFPQRMPAPTNGDGMAWRSDDGAELYIYARRNAGNETPADVIAGREAEDDVTYKASGKSWAVVSGYRNDKIFYERYIFRGDLVHSVAVLYPPDLRSTYDPLVGPVTMTLKAETLE